MKIFLFVSVWTHHSLVYAAFQKNPTYPDMYIMAPNDSNAGLYESVVYRQPIIGSQLSVINPRQSVIGSRVIGSRPLRGQSSAVRRRQPVLGSQYSKETNLGSQFVP